MMTVLDDRPINGEPLLIPKSTPEQGSEPHVPGDPPELAVDPAEVEPNPEQLQAELDERQRSVEILGKLTKVEEEGAFLQRRSAGDHGKDATAARRVRDKARREKERAEKAQVRAARTARLRAWWDDRAERTRQKLVDPARRIGSIHRTWTLCAGLMIALIAGALLYMTDTVKTGVVGPEGTWLGYAIEPMASAMLVISLAVQTLARRNGVAVGKGLITLDVALCAASIVLVVVPWGIRYGWDPSSTLVHAIIPLLVTAAVALWHLSAGLVATMLSRAKEDPALQERLAMLRTAIARGDIPVDPSKNRIEKHLREVLGGISRPEADKVAQHFLGK